jgi:dolichol-phosphate mannosyltransferase
MFGEGPRSLLAIVAALNEQEGIGPTITELQAQFRNVHIVVVDGKSEDHTVEVARDMGAEVISQIGKGKGDALAQAIRQVKTDADYVITTDADYTYPAAYLPKMIKIIEEDPKIGMVCGNRFNSHFRMDHMNNVFHVGNRVLAFTHNLFNGVALRDPLTGLRVVRWEILRNWIPRSRGFDIEVELNHHVERRGYSIVEIPISYRDRLGEKKLKLRHGATILGRIILEVMHS